jgi:predicted ribosome quality control (RQC) complex YloA/Tae2 family protein
MILGKSLRKLKHISHFMPAPTQYTHPINVRSNQLDMPTRGRRDEDYDDKIKSAQLELERIQQERQELERKKLELEELTSRKRAFLSQQVELTEKFSAAVTLIDRELYELRDEADHLEQCRSCFSEHLDKIQKHDPEKWTRDNLHEKLDKALIVTDLAADEYDQATAYFEGTRSGAIFGRPSKGGRRRVKAKAGESEFKAQFLSGLAFNLPVVALGALALIIYLIK